MRTAPGVGQCHGRRWPSQRTLSACTRARPPPARDRSEAAHRHGLKPTNCRPQALPAKLAHRAGSAHARTACLGSGHSRGGHICATTLVLASRSSWALALPWAACRPLACLMLGRLGRRRFSVLLPIAACAMHGPACLAARSGACWRFGRGAELRGRRETRGDRPEQSVPTAAFASLVRRLAAHYRSVALPILQWPCWGRCQCRGRRSVLVGSRASRRAWSA